MRTGSSAVVAMMLGVSVLATSCGAGLNQTSITCSEGRTLLDGVCVREQIADYVSCVRAQGAQLGAEKGQKISAEVGYLGAKAGGAAELNETLQKKYSASDQAMLAIIQACSGASQIEAGGAAASGSGTSKHLVGHWKLDESGGSGASDASEHGNTGSLEGTAAWVTGRIGGALKLDGSQRIAIDDRPSQHSPKALTLAGWFLLSKKDIGHPWRDIFMKTNPKGPNAWGCLDTGVPDPNPCDEREYGVAVKVDEQYLGVYAVTEDHYQNGGQTWCPTPNGTVQFERWQHFAAVISAKGRSIRVFLDGALAATCPLSEAGMRKTSQRLLLGNQWTGMLDDLRIYDTELTDQDVAALAAAK